MRRRCYGSLLAFALACTAPVRAEEIVDLFPGQLWESLQLQAASTQGQALPNPALAAPLPVPMPEAAPEPFTALGEWRQQGQRVLVLQGQSDSYLLCAACKLPKALRPGAKLEHYLFKALERDRVVLLDAEGREHAITLSRLVN